MFSHVTPDGQSNAQPRPQGRRHVDMRMEKSSRALRALPEGTVWNESSEINCYVHSVSPVKKSGVTSYFNCNLQRKSDVIRSVCFAVDKKETLTAMAEQKSPVKIKKYTISNKYGAESVVMNKYTTITPTSATFEYKRLEDITTIASLSNVAPEQLVAIKGYVADLSSTKTLVLQGSPVKKREGYIADPSGYIKVVFWGKHTDTVEPHSTYFFDKLRVKASRNDRYLNTPKNEEECSITSAQPFKENLPVVDNISTTKEITGEIIGVTNINKYMSCCACSKVTIKGKVALCEQCRMTQKTSACKIQWFLRIYIQSSSNPQHKIRLSIYNDAVEKLFNICNVLENSLEDEIVESILVLDKVKLTYDSQSSKLTDIESL